MRILLLTALMAGTAFCAFAQNGVIRELSGDVGLKPAGASDFVQAHAGDAVALDTIISTGFKSIALIEAGSAFITVRPLTRLSFSEIQSASGKETVNANLLTGRVRVDVKPPSGAKANVTFQSGSATASVRGTGFEFDNLNLKVYEGTVIYRGNYGMAIPVPAGLDSYVNYEGKAADPIIIITSEAALPLPAGASAGDMPVSPLLPGAEKNGNVDVTVNW